MQRLSQQPIAIFLFGTPNTKFNPHKKGKNSVFF